MTLLPFMSCDTLRGNRLINLHCTVASSSKFGSIIKNVISCIYNVQQTKAQEWRSKEKGHEKVYQRAARLGPKTIFAPGPITTLLRHWWELLGPGWAFRVVV